VLYRSFQMGLLLRHLLLVRSRQQANLGETERLNHFYLVLTVFYRLCVQVNRFIMRGVLFQLSIADEPSPLD